MSSVLLAGGKLGRRFGDVVALADADIALAAGEVRAIVGENGAGKSTLARILAGILAADAGTITVDGRPARWRSRRDAVAAGIGYLPQSLSFVTTLSLVDNHLLGGSGFRADRKGAAEALTAACRELGVSLPFDVPLGRLGLPQRQLAEIASAVAAGARVLLLDEPTSALGPVEIAGLVAALRRLAGHGTAIGLVTHRIEEVLDGADHVSVLRAGRLVFEGATAGLTADRVAHFMVGDTVPPDRRPPAPRAAIRLKAERLSLARDGVAVLADIGFSLGEGEILGVAGVAGAGQAALAAILAGLVRPQAGTVSVDGRDVTGRAAAALAAGVAHIPDERGAGVVGPLLVAENASLLRGRDAGFARLGLRNRTAEREQGERIVADFDIRPRRSTLPAAGLSGGNQQKLLIGRELDRNPAVIVAHGPTQGLDIAAAARIRDRLVAAAAGGAAVVLISSDLSEILAISHRVLVLSGGRVTDIVPLHDGPPDMVRLGRAIGGRADG